MIKNIRLWLSMQNIDADTVLEAIALSAAIISIAAQLADLQLISDSAFAVVLMTGILWLSR